MEGKQDASTFQPITLTLEGKLLGLYVAVYEVGAIYWQDAAHLILADLGGPHFYYLKLEGAW